MSPHWAHPLRHASQAIASTRRRPEETALYRVLSEHWSHFKREAEEQGGLPEFVSEEVEGYLRCGILEHGFIRAECKACGHEELVAFSCKGRGFCPSCMGRRMNDTAAHLVDVVLPKAPMRQWVASFAWQLRYAMGYDKSLCSALMSCFMRTLVESVKRRAKRHLKLASVDACDTGALLVVQRFDAGLRLNVHAHALVLDGVYVKRKQGGAEFQALPEPSEEDAAWVASTTWRRIERVLKKQGRAFDEADAYDALSDEQPWLAQCYAQSTQGSGALKVMQGEQGQARAIGKGIADLAGGVNVYADTQVDGRDRARLERLMRYMLRPPIAQERLSVMKDGRIHYAMKKAWKDGTSSVVLKPADFIKRLCAMIPAPYFHMTRYYGVFAPNAALRKQVILKPATMQPMQLVLFEGEAEGEGVASYTSAQDDKPSRTKRARLAWGKLLARVFKVDVSVCPRCKGWMRITDVVTKGEDIEAVLNHMGNESKRYKHSREGPSEPHIENDITKPSAQLALMLM